MRLEIGAAPSVFPLDTERCALLVIDMQNDFGAAGGMFARAGIDIAPVRAVVAPIARVVAAARRAKLPVVYLRMGYGPDLSDLGPPGSPNRERHLAFGVGEATVAPDERPSRVLVRDTWNTAIVDELAPEPGDLAIWKTRFSGFYATDLDATLRSRGVTQLIVTGCTTSVCVESTIRDAMFRDYACLLLADCSAEPIGADLPRTNHEASLLVTQALFGWVASSAALLGALGMGVAR
jgi:ureidoacrylate peracid hydrolase